MAEILASLVDGKTRVALEIKRDGILLAQAILERSELEKLIRTLTEQYHSLADSSAGNGR